VGIPPKVGQVVEIPAMKLHRVKELHHFIVKKLIVKTENPVPVH
jgi:hypothetical protein